MITVPDASSLYAFANLKLTNSNIKLLVATGGWNAGSWAFNSISSSQSSVSNYATNVVNFLKQWKLDGFDLDWEYPDASHRSNFIQLLTELKSRLAANSFIFSVAVGATSSHILSYYDVLGISQNVDLINLMTYDLHGSWETRTGINAPLYRGIDTDSRLNVDACVKAWISGGASASKLIVGIPLYGHSFKLATAQNGVGAAASGAGKAGLISQEAGTLSFSEICTNGWQRQWQSDQSVPYAYSGDQWVGYDDIESAKIKSNYISNNNLGGAMFWSIESDDYSGKCGSIINKVYSVFSGIPQPITTPSPNPITTIAPITTTSSSGGKCNSSGFGRDPNDCSKFYQCANGYVYSFTCGAGLYFDLIYNTCNWKEQVQC